MEKPTNSIDIYEFSQIYGRIDEEPAKIVFEKVRRSLFLLYEYLQYALRWPKFVPDWRTWEFFIVTSRTKIFCWILTHSSLNWLTLVVLFKSPLLTSISTLSRVHLSSPLQKYAPCVTSGTMKCTRMSRTIKLVQLQCGHLVCCSMFSSLAIHPLTRSKTHVWVNGLRWVYLKIQVNWTIDSVRRVDGVKGLNDFDQSNARARSNSTHINRGYSRTKRVAQAIMKCNKYSTCWHK